MDDQTCRQILSAVCLYRYGIQCIWGWGIYIRKAAGALPIGEKQPVFLPSGRLYDGGGPWFYIYVKGWWAMACCLSLIHIFIMNLKKMIALLCCGAMVTGALLSGCGNAFESSSDKGETTAEGAASSGSTDSPAAEGDDSVYTVRVWGYGDANSCLLYTSRCV